MSYFYLERETIWLLRPIFHGTKGGHIRQVLTVYLVMKRIVLLHCRWLYWGDQGERRVERCHLDGSQRMILADSSIDWPNQLALDFRNRWVCFNLEVDVMVGWYIGRTWDSWYRGLEFDSRSWHLLDHSHIMYKKNMT